MYYLMYCSFGSFVFICSFVMGGVNGKDILLKEAEKQKGLGEFPVSVIIGEYERIKSFNESATDHEEKFCTEDSSLFDRLQYVYKSAVEESELSLSDCRFPAVIISKYTGLIDSEKEDFTKLLLSAIEAREEETRKKMKNTKPEDYSQSFGGTAADSKNEKEAASLLRGGPTAAADDSSPILREPTITHSFEQFELRRVGRWLKFMGASGCYMYMHNLTREMVSIRPEDFVDESQTTSTESHDTVIVDPANGLPRVDIQNLPAEVERIVTELGRTPLIIDTSPENRVRTFYDYKALLEDVSCLSIPFGKSGLKREDVMERCRKKLVAALKTGGTFVLYLGGVTIEHADFKTKLCKKDVFPKDAFTAAGSKLLQPDYEPRYKLLYREADLEQGQAIARDGFRLVVISSVDPYKYEELLADSIPLGYMTPIYVNH